MTTRRWIVVANAHSGSGADALLPALQEALGDRVDLRRATDPADVPRLAAAAARDAAREGEMGVAACGGDGTIGTVAHEAWTAGCRFGVLPGGTFNYHARTHRIPLDLGAAARILDDGIEQPVQVGLLNGRVFLVNASVGLYPQLLEDREAFKQRFGRRRVVALAAAAWTLLSRRRGLRVVLDPDAAGPAPATTLDTATVFVGNNRLQLDQIGLAEAAEAERGRLAVLVLPPMGTFDMLGLVARGAAGRLGGADAVASFATPALRVTLPRRSRIKVAADGEVRVERLPLEIRIGARPLRMMVPSAPPAGPASDVAP